MRSAPQASASNAACFSTAYDRWDATAPEATEKTRRREESFNPAAAVPRHSSAFRKTHVSTLLALMFVVLPELQDRICLNASIFPVFFRFFLEKARLNRPDSRLNRGVLR
ncbi:hypothetical protein [Candidatus Electronema sp. PJ]|uniref:hypothetical protein n=1 Tax=Candidatus Electronema sp. PJ TaxID=3401572 RepID=UPI003AA96C59